MREVDHAGAYHVVAVRVRTVGTQAALNGVCRELAVRMWEREYLVTAGFDCACLMHRDMPCIGGNHALVGTQECRNHNAVYLCPAHEKMDLCMRCAACSAYLLPRRFRVRIASVACRLLQIRLCEPPQNLRVRSLHIVRGKGKPFAHIIISFSIRPYTIGKYTGIQGAFLRERNFFR